MDFGILGPVRVRADDGSELTLPSPKTRAVLAILLLHRNELLPTRDLIGELWSGDPPRTAENAVQVYVSALRKAFEAASGTGSVLETGRRGYLMRVEPDQLDADRFERLRSEGLADLRRGSAERAARRLHEALRLWRGPALADLRAERFAQHEIARLEDLRLSAFEEWIDAELALGRHDDVLGDIERLTGEHPLRERFYGQLMLALYRLGRQADALATYRTMRTRLIEQAGVEPGPAVRDLHKRILQQDPSLDLSSTTALRVQTPLPARARSFVGRRRELAAVMKLLAGPDTRLLTLTGTPGVGKTRLALEAAERVTASFTHGVAFVQLGAVTTPAEVGNALRIGLGIESAEGAASVRGLADALADRHLLLVLDTFEHLLDKAEFVAELSRECESLHVLVTSRSPLRVSGEHAYEVPPLPLPPLHGDRRAIGKADAVALFVDRARSAQPAFELTDTNARAVAECCRRLDGLPLAIELAAARVRLMPPEAIAGRLERRLDLLTGGPRDLLERQRSLRAALEWSYDLLGDDEQRLFERLSVFSDGWTLEAAEELNRDQGIDVVACLDSLLDKHLVQRTDGGVREPRFAMLDTVHEYARERLFASGDEEALRRRHAEHFVTMAERAGAELRGPRQEVWLTRLETEHENLTAALAWAVEKDVQLALRAVGAISRYWLVRGSVAEGLAWSERVIAVGDGQPAELLAPAVRAASVLFAKHGDYDRAKELGERSLALCREVGDDRAVAAAANAVGIAAVFAGDFERARALYDESIRLMRRTGDTSGLVTSLANSADLALNERDFAKARELFEESLVLARELEDKEVTAIALCNLGIVAVEQERPREALALLAESLEVSRGLGFRDEIAQGLATVAAALALEREADEAAQLLAAADAELERTGATFGPFERELRERTETRVRSQLDDEQYETARQAGSELNADDAIARVLSRAADSTGVTNGP
jgi:predicted ATPase/DNA-binding SARP family transcriptional activator